MKCSKCQLYHYWSNYYWNGTVTVEHVVKEKNL